MVSPNTGNLATITFGTSAFAGRYVEVGSFEESRPVLPDSDLSSTGHEECVPGDLLAPGPIQCQIYWDMDNRPPVTAVPELITITTRPGQGQTNGATLAGTGFISARTGPVLQNNQRLMGSFTIQFDGKTGPTYTSGS